jgi:hypothetical protein
MIINTVLLFTVSLLSQQVSRIHALFIVVETRVPIVI